MGEFELIRRHFQRAPAPAGDTAVVLGIGDDCALLQPSPGHQLAISSDMLVEGRHFFADVDPEALGHKALAVNLSDLAAMGARPLGFTLALALPHADGDWLACLARGLFALADAHACPLVGGDTTRGPLNLCVTAFGEIAAGRAIRRGGARAGDGIWISGQPGRAALGLADLLGKVRLHGSAHDECIAALEQPQPRVALGAALQGLATAMIDVSDGLLADLGHIARASGLGAVVDAAALPWAALHAACTDGAATRDALLAGGDDYELLFCAPPEADDALAALSARLALPLTRIGAMQSGDGVRLVDAAGAELPVGRRGYDHFA